MNLNRAMIIGNLTRDPETRTLASGQTVCTFGIATSMKWKDKASGENREQTEFHTIVAWGKLGEICQQYLKKGRKAYVEGRLQTRNWDDKTHADVKHYRTEIVADDMILLDKAPVGAADTTGRDDAAHAAATAGAPVASAKPAPAPAAAASVDDIPFE